MRRALPGMVELSLVLLLALQAARLLWLVVPPVPFGVPESPAAAPVTETTFTDIFYPRDTARTATGGEEALGYRLYGIRTGLNASTGHPGPDSAILAGKDKVQHTWREGESLGNGIVLARVGRDHVVLRARGAEHRLDLPRAPPPPASARSLPRTAPAPAAGTPAPSPQPGNIEPRKLLSGAGLRTNTDGGYTLTPRGDGALFRQAGLEPGDVLMSVDGRPLDRERLGELESELKNRSSATLTVKRDGRTHTITLQAKQP